MEQKTQQSQDEALMINRVNKRQNADAKEVAIRKRIPDSRGKPAASAGAATTKS
jgi:hypothetical protein